MTYNKRVMISAAFLVLILTLTGCTTPSIAPQEPTAALIQEPQPATPTNETVRLSMAVGGTEDGWYALGNRIATDVTERIPNMEMSVQTTSSLMENLKLLLNGKVDMAFGYDYHIMLANQGNLAKAFPGAPPEVLHIKCGAELVRPVFPDYAQQARIVVPIYEQQLHILATDASGITTLNDLRGKRVSIGVPDSVTEELAVYLLDGLNFDLENDLALAFLSVDESIVALENGELDAFFWSGRVPDLVISDWIAASGLRIDMIPVGEGEAAQIMRAHPGIFHKSKILANSYESLDADVDSLAVTLVLAAMADLPADQVRRIVSTLFEGEQGIEFALNETIPFTPELSIFQLGVEGRTYLHDSSAEYFREQGVLEQVQPHSPH